MQSLGGIDDHTKSPCSKKTTGGGTLDIGKKGRAIEGKEAKSEMLKGEREPATRGDERR